MDLAPALILALYNKNNELDKKNKELITKINELEKFIYSTDTQHNTDKCDTCGYICLALQEDYTRCDLCDKSFHTNCGLKSLCRLCLKQDCNHKIMCQYEDCKFSKNTYMKSCHQTQHKSLCYLHIPMDCGICEGISVDLCNDCYEIFISSDNPHNLIKEYN